MFVAGLTRRFVSAKRLFRDLYVGKLVEHRAQSPVRKFKMLRDETPRQTSHEHFTSDIFSILYCINFNSCTCGWESFCDRGPDC